MLVSEHASWESMSKETLQIRGLCATAGIQLKLHAQHGIVPVFSMHQEYWPLSMPYGMATCWRLQKTQRVARHPHG